MAFAAITCVAAALFVAGLVGLGILNARFAVHTAIDQVRFDVFFHPETTRDEARAAYRRIETLPDVASAEFVTREEGWRRELKKAPDLAGLIGKNPLPDKVVVKPTNLRAIPELARQLEKWPEVEIVKHVPKVSDVLENFNSGVNNVGTIVGIILAVLSLVIIHHTIELTLYARRREIFIMSLVGATPTTIAMPFLLEGMVYGLIGAAVATGSIVVLYQYLSNSMLQTYNTRLFSESSMMWHGVVILLAGGVILGLFGSLMSVLKYLNSPRSKTTNA